MMKAKVLSIEDDRDLANLFKIVLEMSGFEVSAVHDGMQGVEVLEDTKSRSVFVTHL